jgi:hypothetical protein
MENKVSPFFTGFLGRKSQSAIFGGSYLEIKPLEYINRRFYKFQFITRTKLKLQPTQISFYQRYNPTSRQPDERMTTTVNGVGGANTAAAAPTTTTDTTTASYQSLCAGMTYEQFMKHHVSKPGEAYTHTRIGDKALNVYGGVYTIPPAILPVFWKKYYTHVFETGKHFDFF